MNVIICADMRMCESADVRAATEGSGVASGGQGGDICPGRRGLGAPNRQFAQIIIALTGTGPRAHLESC